MKSKLLLIAWCYWCYSCLYHYWPFFSAMYHWI